MKKGSKLVIYFLFFMWFFTLSKAGSIKYVFSLAVVFNLFIILSKNSILNKRLTNVTFIWIVPIIYIVIYTLVIVLINGKFEFYTYTIKQIIFMVIPILASYSLVLILGKKLNIPKVIFISIGMVFILNNILEFNIYSFKSDLFEGTEAFIFGLFMIYFAYKKDKLYFFISLIGMYLAHKRIVLAASIITLILYAISEKIKYKNRKKFNFIVYITLICISLVFIYIIYSGQLADIFIRYNINDMGRLHLYSLFDNNYKFSIFFIGNGIGYVDKLLDLYNLYFGSNLHSDFLKIYIEIGMLGYIVYFYMYYISYKYIQNINNKVGNLYIYLFIFTIFNYFTDNLLIYIYYLIPLYSIVLWEIQKNELIKLDK